jgi:PhzF family phenazine biosynthesis protein
MTHRPFQLVDVFPDDPAAGGAMTGNPLAVVFDADGLSTEEMQGITQWLNLSETTFLVTPTDPLADYHVRIFTLDRELPFAGHPTLGTCHAWLRRGGQPKTPGRVMQQCGVGLVEVRQGPEVLSFAAPPLIRSGPVEAELLAAIVDVLQVPEAAVLEAAWAANGPGWIMVRLASAEAVLALQPKRTCPVPLDLGVVGPYPPGGALAYEVRALFTAEAGSLREDPVTGSLNASVAQSLLAAGRVTAPYVASQGTAIGRRGRVFIDQDGTGQVWVGGRAVTMFEGVTV